jgi:hypothetical protein
VWHGTEITDRVYSEYVTSAPTTLRPASSSLSSKLKDSERESDQKIRIGKVVMSNEIN